MPLLRTSTIALLATAASLLAPGRLRAQDLACDQGDREVRALEFRGNLALSDADLRVQVLTTPSDRVQRWLRVFGTRRCVGPQQLAADIIRLRRYYPARGFHHAEIDTVVQSRGDGSIRVLFTIQEGRPTLLQAYTITGLTGIPDSADIARKLRLRPGMRWDLGLFQADQDSIVAHLRDAGYFRASVIPAYDRVDSLLAASAEIQVVPGKQARFGEARIQVTPVDERGQQIPDAIVRRIMGIRPGQMFSDRAITEAQRSLFQLNAYRHLEVSPDSALSTDTLVVLSVSLTEDYMRQLDSELGYATLDCGRVRLQYSDRNIFRSARRLELTAQATKIGFGAPVNNPLSEDICAGLGTLLRSQGLRGDRFSTVLHYFVGATYRQPRLLGTEWVPTMSLYSERRGEFKAYLRSTQIGGDFSATRDLAARMPLRLGYAIEYGHTDAEEAALCALFSRCDPDSRAGLDRLATLGVASASLVRLQTDNVVSPTRGSAFRAEVRSSASKLLGTSDELFFNKATGDLALYAPLTARSVLALRLRGGMVLGRRLRLTDPTGIIPPQERLYAGGPTSVRGFQQNELGKAVYIARRENVTIDSVPGTTPTEYFFQVDTTENPDRTVPLGGNSLFVVNAELRLRVPFLLPDLLQFTPFMDGGSVWTREDAATQQMKWTPGLGVRALTPIGPVQMNVGYNRYRRVPGAMYHNPDFKTLACATPNSGLRYTRDAFDILTPTTATKDLPCRPASPPARDSFWQKLTFTFSIGSDF